MTDGCSEAWAWSDDAKNARAAALKTDPSTMAREVAEWLGWLPAGEVQAIRNMMRFKKPCGSMTTLWEDEIALLHAACVRERELREEIARLKQRVEELEKDLNEREDRLEELGELDP